MNSEWYNQTIIIRSNGLFVEIVGGCVYDIQSTGRWKTQNDTLVLEISKREDLRSKRQLTFNHLMDKYLIKADTLFQVNSEKNKVNFVADFALIRQKEK